jgi:hypothetical protein
MPKKIVIILSDDIDRLDSLSDAQLWEAAADTRNAAEIRQEAIRCWLFPDETNPDAAPDDLSGGRLRELRRRATVLESDEMDEDEIEDVEEMALYFDTQGRLILEHDGVFYLIDGSDDEGVYDGIRSRDDLFTTDDKTNMRHLAKRYTARQGTDADVLG